MDRYVVRHPDLGGPALVPESSLLHHLEHGWLRVSGPIDGDDAHRVLLHEYTDAPDLGDPSLPSTLADLGGKPADPAHIAELVAGHVTSNGGAVADEPSENTDQAEPEE